MIRKYLTLQDDANQKDWRIKKGVRYPIVGEIGDNFFVWANGHQSIVPKSRDLIIETEEVKEEYWNEHKRTSKKRKSNR